MEGSMPKPCSMDLRERVLEAVMAGASRREAAERFEISASSAVKWLQRFDETGSIAAKPTGGSTSALEEHADFLLAPDCRAIGYDAGRGGSSDAQATD